MTFYYPPQQRKVKPEVYGDEAASLWRGTAPGRASSLSPSPATLTLLRNRNHSDQLGGGPWKELSCLKSAASTWDHTAHSGVTCSLGGRWESRVPLGDLLGVALLVLPIPCLSVLWPVLELWDENAAKPTSCQSESELAFDLEDLCFRFFFFFFSFFLFLCFSFFFFLCFSLHSEELELLSLSSEVESSSNCFNCCILNIKDWSKNRKPQQLKKNLL